MKNIIKVMTIKKNKYVETKKINRATKELLEEVLCLRANSSILFPQSIYNNKKYKNTSIMKTPSTAYLQESNNQNCRALNL